MYNANIIKISMGNYKYMEEVIGKMAERGKPFLIIKYGITAFNGLTNNAYELVTMGSKKLQYFPLDRTITIRVIERHSLPLLHRLDSRNEIWGDERFKEQFKEKSIKI